jgi:DNA-binding LacI/PurR family transcriptional regulator
MSVTQKQIAAEVGLSRSMVALALSGHPKISEQTRLRVEQAAQRLGYTEHSNAGARALIAKRYGQQVKTGTLAVLLPDDVEGMPLKEMPFYVPMLRGMEVEAATRGIDLVLCPQRSQLPRLIGERHVDGVVCVENGPLVQAISELSLPVVAIDFASEWAHTLLPDEREGTRLATEYLIELGHERIAYLGFFLEFLAARERFAGYQDALQQHNLSFDESLIDLNVHEMHTRAGAEAVERLLSKDSSLPFTALVCYNDMLAMGAVRQLEMQGFAVPQDVSVVGYDDISPDYQFQPALTSIRFDRQAMGRAAIAMLCNVDEEASLCHHRFDVDLVVRDSTASLNFVRNAA